MSAEVNARSSLNEAFVMIRILELIPQHRWITMTQIRNQLAADGIPLQRRTLERYMKTIRENPQLFPVKANMDSRPYGFQWDTAGRGLHFPVLGPQETLLLRLADEYLHYLLPSSVLSGLRPLFRDARKSTEVQASSRASSWLRKVKVVSPALPFLPPQISRPVFDAVTEALLEDRMVSIRYRNARDRVLEANVKPLGLVQQDVRTYLVCQFEKFSDYRHLAMHRIEAATVSCIEFERPEDFDLEDYTANAPFNYSQGRTVKLELLTDDPTLIKNLSETPFNTTQTIEEKSLEDGTLAWTVTVMLEDSILLDGWLAMRRNSILSTTRRSCATTGKRQKRPTANPTPPCGNMRAFRTRNFSLKTTASLRSDFNAEASKKPHPGLFRCGFFVLAACAPWH